MPSPRFVLALTGWGGCLGVFLTSYEMLSVGDGQINLALLSLRIFDFVQNTLVRQCLNKFGIALTYPYFCGV